MSPNAKARVCERIVVFSKRDLVPDWGIEVGLLPSLCQRNVRFSAVMRVLSVLTQSHGRASANCTCLCQGYWRISPCADLNPRVAPFLGALTAF
jgi:hypothetical protein